MVGFFLFFNNNRAVQTLKIFFLIIVIFLIGTFGYVFIEGWSVFDSFYMTAISITTVGFGETFPLSPAGKIFTIMIIFLGLGAAAVFATHLAKVFLESHFKNFFGANKMLKKITRLKGHYIICGYGGVGSAICATLNDSGIKFVVIEQDENVAQWAQKRNYLTVVGKATYDTTLIQAGIKSAKGIVVSMGDDSLNMYVSLAARELNADIFIIARGYKADIESRLVRAGANTVVYPIRMGGEQIAHLIKRQLHTEDTSNVVHDELSGTVMGYSLRLYRHNCDGSTTVENIIKTMQCLNVVTLKRKNDEEITNPSSELVVNKNDTLLLVVSDNKKDDHKITKESLFYWKDELDLGYSPIDLEHKNLFETSFRFVESVKRGAEKEVVIRAFNKLVEDTITHFESEERLFAQYNYSEKKNHTKTHKVLLSKITDLNKNRNYDFPGDIEKTLFVSQRDHIMECDKAFVAYITDNFNS